MAAPSERSTARPTAWQRLADLRVRALTAAVFVPCLLVIAWRGAPYFVVFVNLLLLLAMAELLRLQHAKHLAPDAGIAYAAAVLLPWSVFLQHGARADLVLAVLFVTAALRLLRRQEAEHGMASLGATTFAVLYVGWMGAHLVRLRELPTEFARDPAEGFRFVLLAFLFTWVSDTAAYLFGTLFGRHRLAPRISPAKSLEGGIAALWCTGLLGAIAAATFMRPFFAPFVGVWLGVLASAIGQVGDLLASVLKRDAAVKDASRLIPGHGGVLDRFDSVLFVAPLVYYALRFVVL